MVSGMHIDQTWKIVLSDLRDRGRINPREFGTFLETTRLLVLDRETGKAIVGAPDTFTVENLTNPKYRDKIIASLRAVTPTAEWTVFTDGQGQPQGVSRPVTVTWEEPAPAP